MPWRLLAVAIVSILAACAPRARPAAPGVPAATFAARRADPTKRARLLALTERLDQHYRAQMAAAEATGLVVGVVLDGELVYARAFGWRDAETRAPLDEESVFHIASLTKSFTAAAVLRLRDEGKVVLDAPAATYLPELAGVRGPTRDAPAMTVRHLLTHASGLAFDDAWGAVSYGWTEAQLDRALAGGITLAAPPGTRYAYSNLGYALLGRLVERVTGVPLRAYVTAHLLRPLGMSGTVWDPAEVPSGRLAVGYRRVGQRLVREPRVSMGAFAGAGALYTSLHDYARYVAFQLAAYPPRDEAESGPLLRSTLREMHEGQRWSRWRGDDVPLAARTADGGLALGTSSYGFGWLNNTTCAYEGMVQHGGGDPGYWSTVHLLPRHGLGVITMATTGAVGFRAIGGTLAILRAGGLLDPPEPPPSPAVVDAASAVGTLLQRWDGALVERTFDGDSLRFPEMADLEQEFARLRRAHGTCAPEGAMHAAGPARGTWRLRCARGALEMSMFLTPVGPPRVQLLAWREERPVNAATAATAARLAAALGTAAPADLFSAGAAGEKARRTLARLSIDHGACALSGEPVADEDGRVRARVACGEGELRLVFRADDQGRLTELSGGPAPGPDAVCAP